MDAVDVAGAARMIGRSRSWFYKHRNELRKVGFPEELPISKRFDVPAIVAWKERQGELLRDTRDHAAKFALDDAFGI
jgi:hypothetical protein